MLKSTSIIYKFVRIVKEKFDLDLDYNSYRRTYAGYWQRSVGTWAWSMNKIKTGDVGSQSRMTDLVKQPDHISFNGEEFFLENHVVNVEQNK